MIIGLFGQMWAEISTDVGDMPDGSKSLFARPLLTDKWFVATNAILRQAHSIPNECQCVDGDDRREPCQLCRAEAANRYILEQTNR